MLKIGRLVNEGINGRKVVSGKTYDNDADDVLIGSLEKKLVHPVDICSSSNAEVTGKVLMD